MAGKENWVHGDSMSATRKRTIKKLNELKEARAGKKTILIPHPTSPRAFIERIVENN